MVQKNLDALFGLPERMKIIRLFVFNPERAFDIEMVVKKTGLKKSIVLREIAMLKKFELITPKKFSKIVSENPKRMKKVSGFLLSQSFDHLVNLRIFLLATSPNADDVLKRFLGVGKIKLLIVAGVFIQDSESRLDILIVGDGLKKHTLDKVIASLESDIGKELSYFVVNNTDFSYRMSMNDKLLRDVLDYPHQKIINKLGV